MIRYRSIVFVALQLQLALLHAQPIKLSAMEVARRAANDNPLVKAQLAQNESSDARLKDAQSGLFPQLDAIGSYTYLDPIAHIPFPIGNGQVQDFAFQPHNNYEANLRLSYLAFDFGQRNSGVAIARAGQQLSAHQLDQVRNDLAMRAVQVYYGVLGYQEAIAVQQKLIAALDENIRRADARIQAESATGYDKLTVQSRRSEAERDLIRLEQQRDQQLTMLRQLLGLTPGTQLELSDDGNGRSSATADTSGWHNRPDYLMQNDRLEQARLNLELNQRRGLPSLSVFAQGGMRNGYQPDINANVNNWAAGASLNIPIFHGNKKVSLVEQARAELKQNEFQTKAAEDKARAEIDQASTALASALRELETTNTLVQQADETARRARVRYENGLATSLELLDAETANSRAQQSQLQAHYAVAVASYNLPYAAGVPIYQ